MHKSYPYFALLIILSALFISIAANLLPLIPTKICIAGTYTALALEYTKQKEAPIKATEPAVPVVAISKIKEIGYTESTSPIQLQNDSGYEVELPSLLKDYSPVKKKNEPQILIVHTHATESYIECDNRSLDETKNMVAVGKALKDSLENYGFSVLHDTTYHDYPNYNGSYANSLKTVESYLAKHPTIDIVLDIHRDGIETEDGQKMAVKTEIDGVSYAKLMIVAGTDACGLYHPLWKENLKFAAMLQQTLNGFSESLMRPLNLRYERFNQHLTKNSLIIEVGSNGNTLDEAIRSAKLLAKALSLYIKE